MPFLSATGGILECVRNIGGEGITTWQIFGGPLYPNSPFQVDGVFKC